jgi:UDP-N-acetylmuramate: L-alanyl-gamma-D-glutamyl-meso-diaminopimelate ligase
MRAHAFCRVERYGFSESADWRIRNLRHEDGLTRWEVWRNGAPGPTSKCTWPASTTPSTPPPPPPSPPPGHPKPPSEAALATFKSVKRRLEVRAEINGITIIDDFAHHPTAIRETLRALRSVYPQARLWAVLEPRSNTLRRKVLAADLVASLRLADRVVLAGVYQQQRIPDAERLHPEDVVRALNDAGTPAELSRRRRHRQRHRAAARNPATSSPSSPMAASTASMRNCPRASRALFPAALKRRHA